MNTSAQHIALQSCSRGAARRLLLGLLLEAGEDGCCVVTTARLGALAGMKRNHVSRAAGALVALGELSVEPMASTNKVNRYRLTLPMQESPLSPSGATTAEPSAPPPAAPAPEPIDEIHRLRAEAWAAFDPHGRPWHHATEAEREAFAESEHGRRFLSAVSELAGAAGVRVAPSGEIAEFGC